MKVKNVSPLGDLVVPALNLVVKAGDVVDVSEEAATSLLEQPANWAPGDAKAAKVAPEPTSTPDAPADPAA
jgi:hypothetical protein